MKTWSKKVMTLACAACLTVGMAAVACADTIDLGYGQYATTNNGVHATAIEIIPTNPTFRTKEQNKAINETNKAVQEKLSKRIKEVYKVEAPPFKGNYVDGYSLYQLSGDSNLGHHTAWLMTYNLNKDIIDYSGDVSSQIVGSTMTNPKVGTESKKILYSKSNAEEFISKLKPLTFERNILESRIANINARIQRDSFRDINQELINNKSLSLKEQQNMQETIDVLKKVIPNFTVGATEISSKPYASKFGTIAGLNMRGSLKYDGFVLPGSLTMYAMPQNDGLTVQILATEDTSRDYWTGQLESMYALKTLKGGNK